MLLSARGCRELALSEIMSLLEQQEAAAAAGSAHQRRQLLEVQGMGECSGRRSRGLELRRRCIALLLRGDNGRRAIGTSQLN